MALGLAEIVKRLGYHPAKASTVSLYEANRHRAIELALYWDETLPDCREKSLAMTSLQEALSWANATVACRMTPDNEAPLLHDPEYEPPPADLLG